MHWGPLLVSTPAARNTLKPISKQAGTKPFFMFGLVLQIVSYFRPGRPDSVPSFLGRRPDPRPSEIPLGMIGRKLFSIHLGKVIYSLTALRFPRLYTPGFGPPWRHSTGERKPH